MYLYIYYIYIYSITTSDHTKDMLLINVMAARLSLGARRPATASSSPHLLGSEGKSILGCFGVDFSLFKRVGVFSMAGGGGLKEKSGGRE